MSNNGDAINDAIAPLEERLNELDARIGEGEEWKVETTKILARLSTIVIGDKEIGHRGLTDRVNDHSTYIAGQETIRAEIRGGKKMLVFISAVAGALLSKVSDAALAFFSSRGH